jgi:hypothetical protein
LHPPSATVFCIPDTVRTYPGPLLGLHGADDELIAPADGRAIAEASAHPHSRFVAFAGHGHNDPFAAAAYLPTLDAWLRAALPASWPHADPRRVAPPWNRQLQTPAVENWTLLTPDAWLSPRFGRTDARLGAARGL